MCLMYNFNSIYLTDTGKPKMTDMTKGTDDTTSKDIDVDEALSRYDSRINEGSYVRMYVYDITTCKHIN